MNSQILLVDDNPGMIQLMARILAGLGQIRFATSGEAAIRQVRDMRPDLILLDAEMPGMDGFQVCKALKDDPEMADVPVVFVTGHVGQEFELKALACGAADFIHKPVSGPLLQARASTQLRIKHLNDELKRCAITDALTDTANRRALDSALQREWQRSQRSAQPLSLLMVDLDHFKHFNDRFGHPAGDACLVSVARALKATCQRSGDLVARYGGEEFALLLPDTPHQGAQHLAKQVLEAVAALRLPHPASPCSDQVTVSIGIAWHDAADDTDATEATEANWAATRSGVGATGRPARHALQLLQSADQALYAAKAAGRAQAWQLSIDHVDQPGRACCAGRGHTGTLPARAAPAGQAAWTTATA